MTDFTNTTGQESWLRRALQKAQGILAEGVAPLPDDNYVQRCMVEDVEDKIEKQARYGSRLISMKDCSIISEGLICDLINQGLVFGPEASGVKTNRYDDYINHTDLLVELPGLRGRYLAIDVTCGAVLDKKMKRLKNEIKSGRLTNLTYAVSDNQQPIPKLLLGLDLQNLLKVAHIWVDQPEHLAESSLLSSLYGQIDVQLAGYGNYARHVGRDEVAKLYQELLSYLAPIISSLRSQSSASSKDKVSDAVMAEAVKLKNFSHSI